MQGDNKGFQVCKRKMISSAEQLCSDHPDAFRKFTDFVLNMKFDEEPNYGKLAANWQVHNICSSCYTLSRGIQLATCDIWAA